MRDEVLIDLVDRDVITAGRVAIELDEPEAKPDRVAELGPGQFFAEELALRRTQDALMETVRGSLIRVPSPAVLLGDGDARGADLV